MKMATVRETETALKEFLKDITDWKGRTAPVHTLFEKHRLRLEHECTKPFHEREMPVVKRTDGIFEYLGAQWK